MRRASVDSFAVMIALALFPMMLSVDAASGAGWGVEQPIETNSLGNAHNPDVSVNSAGNAVAVWSQNDGVRENIWSNRYAVGTGWGIAELIETDNRGTAYDPKVSVDSLGNAIAVWYQYDGVRYNIWSNRYVVGTGWGTAQLIETDDAGGAFLPDVSVDAAGNAIAVWYQYDVVRSNIWSNRYIVGAGWVVAQLIETDNSGDALGPAVSVDSAGNAVAVWIQSDGVNTNIWSNRFVVGTGWGTAQLIETGSLGDVVQTEVSINGAGDAIAVWSYDDGTYFSIYSNRYVVGTGWGTAQLIENGSLGDAWNAQVAVAGSGDAVAVWWQSDGSGYDIWSNRYVVGTGWGTAQLIETDDRGGAEYPSVSLDSSGNAIAVWTQYDGVRSSILSNRYVVGTGWGTAQLIETNNGGGTLYPVVSVDGAGNAIAVWVQNDGVFDSILSNRYIKPDTAPPSLSLSSPTQGLTVETPVITVTGVTEPGVILRINGVLVAVGPDGSFSCELALVDGSNTILANATDAAGNSVTVSRTVTYLNTIPSLRDELNAQSLILMVLFAIFAVLAVAMFVMYSILRKKAAGMGAVYTSFGTSLHDVKKNMNDQEFIDFVIANITQFNKEIEEIDKEKTKAEKAGKKWPSTATERGSQMRQEVLVAKKIELETAKGCAEEGGIDAAKTLADKALGDFSALEIGATLVAYAADLLGYSDIPLPGLGNILNVLKKLFGNKKVLKAVEIAEKALKEYEAAKSDVEKVEKLKELAEKVKDVKKALGE